MAQFKAVVYLKRSGECLESTPGTLQQAEAFAHEHLAKAKVVTILRDSGGEDHPDNAGKFFLHRIVK